MADADERAAARLEVDGTRLALAGELELGTVTSVLARGRQAVADLSGTRAVLDLSAVKRSDSAGLALVVDWLRAARAHGVELSVEGVSSQLADIARVSGLEELLGMEDAGAA